MESFNCCQFVAIHMSYTIKFFVLWLWKSIDLLFYDVSTTVKHMNNSYLTRHVCYSVYIFVETTPCEQFVQIVSKIKKKIKRENMTFEDVLTHAKATVPERNQFKKKRIINCADNCKMYIFCDHEIIFNHIFHFSFSKSFGFLWNNFRLRNNLPNVFDFIWYERYKNGNLPVENAKICFVCVFIVWGKREAKKFACYIQIINQNYSINASTDRIETFSNTKFNGKVHRHLQQ